MSDRLDIVSETAARINEIRQRIKALDEERAQLAEQLEESLGRLALLSGATSGKVTYSADIDAQILRLLRRHEGHPLAPRDIGNALNMGSPKELTYLRVKLSRLVRAGKVKRTDHGRYATA